ncbi:MAG: ORF6N domain-containing protein [Elusimicrobiota bacterium]|jgi:hypothetical protein|nr:ORF6N domain-containing protein [Elusimicrobiota bacterium]
MKFRIIRNQKVITDADLAEALGIPNKALISFLKRNKDEFAQDSYFTLTQEEQQDLVKNYCFTHAERLRYAKRMPYVFTTAAIIMILCMTKKNQVAKMLRNKFFTTTQIVGLDIENILN